MLLTPNAYTWAHSTIGTARASAGCCISIAASATPSGNAAIPNTVQTKKYATPTSAVKFARKCDVDDPGDDALEIVGEGCRVGHDAMLRFQRRSIF